MHMSWNKLGEATGYPDEGFIQVILVQTCSKEKRPCRSTFKSYFYDITAQEVPLAYCLLTEVCKCKHCNELK